jgi:protein-tyrosine phosphatase
MTKVLMVCMANICRSPMARVVAQQLAHEAGRETEFEFSSAGTQVQRGGAPQDPRSISLLLHRNYRPGNSRSRAVTLADFERFDLILAMDEATLAGLERQCPMQYRSKLRLLLAYSPALGVSEVPDPYFGNPAGFEKVLELCEAGARGLLRAIPSLVAGWG